MPKPVGWRRLGRKAVPNILSISGSPKLVSWASASVAWCQWCHSGVGTIQRSTGNRNLTLACWKRARKAISAVTPANVTGS
jgi:hypothetical protein